MIVMSVAFYLTFCDLIFVIVVFEQQGYVRVVNLLTNMEKTGCRL